MIRAIERDAGNVKDNVTEFINSLVELIKELEYENKQLIKRIEESENAYMQLSSANLGKLYT